MKKILSIIIAFICIFALVMFAGYPKTSASAKGLNYSQFAAYQNEVLTEFSQFKNRINGTKGEAQAADFIKSKLDELCLENNLLSPVNSASIEAGVQEFRFNSVTDGLDYYSQNLIYFHKSQSETDKKVIIGTNYDSFALEINDTSVNFVESEGINSSAGSVALLLAIVKSLPSLNLPFNVEIIFFGAGESNNAGSNHYVKGILPEIKDNILCMINLDNLAVGENLYFYVDEVKIGFSDFIEEASLGSSQIQLVHLGKTLLDYENELGLDYYHIAMSSDNINFMSQQILSINFFSGDYEEGIIYGRSEHKGEELLTYTPNDNLKNIAEKYGANYVSQNLFKAYEGVVSLLSNDNFAGECADAQNQTKLFYGIFGSQKIITYLTAVVLIVIIAIVIGIHLKLSLKSYDANIEPEFLSTIISISQNIDETCADENIPKAVSQVVANDIKKDKIIKSKKNKKDS